MSRYLVVKHGQTVVIDKDTYVIVLPDDVSPWTYNVADAGDDTRVQVFDLIEQLEFDDSPLHCPECVTPHA